MSFWWWPLAFLLLLIVPSARLHVFDGLPLSGLPELAAFFLIVPLFASGALRRLYARPLHWQRGASAPRTPRPTLFAAALLLAIAAKLLLLAAGERSGFAACYQTAIPERASDACERSYENLFFREGVTRIDETISFDPVTWNLSFVNSLKFNYYPWQKNDYDRNRLPFTARWRGEIDPPAPASAGPASAGSASAGSITPITLTYVGEGSLRIKGVTELRLPPAYRHAETITLEVPAGRRAFALDYRFDDGSRVGDGPAIQRGPFASLHVRVGGMPLRAIEAPLAWRALGGFVDLTMMVILASIVWCYARLLRRDAKLAAGACVGGLLLAIDPTVTMRAVTVLDHVYRLRARGLPGGIGLIVFAGTLFVLIARRPSTRLLLLAFLAIGWASAFRQDFFLRGYHTVFYQDGGGDWLAYQGFARTILETGSLEGGEAIFFHQPLFRYTVFLTHALFGDGDTLIALFAQALLIWSLFWMSARLLPRGMIRGAWRTVGIAIGLLLVALVTSEPVSHLIYVGASEYPTWIAFTLLFPRLALPASRREWWLGSMMVGLSLITRMNQAIALGWLFAVFLWRRAAARPALAIQPVLLVLAFAALPTAHNLYYGGHLAVLPSEHAMTRTLPMPPSLWLRVFDDETARNQALEHLGAITYSNRIAVGTPIVPTDASHLVFMTVCRGLQAAWILAAILLFKTKTTSATTATTMATAKLLLILPALYLGVHLFYQVRDYHPRFIVIGYLAMGAVAMLAVRARQLPIRA
jgi:hypothetical protein